jgi:hypothetical protein
MEAAALGHGFFISTREASLLLRASLANAYLRSFRSLAAIRRLITDE